MEQEIATQVVGLGGADNFSLWHLFARADIVVKSVIIILLASSVYSWALIFDKFKLFKKINKTSEEFEEKFWKSKSVESFNNNLQADVNDPLISTFKAAMVELNKTKSKSSAVQSARVEKVLELNMETQITKIEKNFTFLATVGSTTPFIGLFGNSLGYHEFISIDCHFKKH